MTDPHRLLGRVSAVLTGAGVPHALIGAAALAAHGISRSTLDIDLLVIDGRVLSRGFWSAIAQDVDLDVRTGDADDPLAGVVRCRAAGERDVDIVVGRSGWQADVLTRARAVGTVVPTVGADDLVLLKLYAGGSQDRWDIEQLLALPGRDALVRTVDARVGALPVAARRLWEQLRD